MNTPQQTFRELATLARDRCRAENELVLQLLDNEQECAALLIAVATDMVVGASSYLGDDRPDALQVAVKMVIDNLRFSATRARAEEMSR